MTGEVCPLPVPGRKTGTIDNRYGTKSGFKYQKMLNIRYFDFISRKY